MKTKVEKHFDRVAADYDSFKENNKFYYDSLKELLKSLIPPKKTVFEIGCGTGDLLDYLKPEKGYGMDISGEMIALARKKYQARRNLQFSTFWPKGGIDYIFMSDVVEHLEDPVGTFKRVSKLMGPKTRFINTMANPFWEPALMLWEALGWKMPEGPHKRFKYKELRIMVEECGMKVEKHDYRLLVPVKIPFITGFMNKYLEKFLKPFAFIEYFSAVKV